MRSLIFAVAGVAVLAGVAALAFDIRGEGDGKVQASHTITVVAEATGLREPTPGSCPLTNGDFEISLFGANVPPCGDGINEFTRWTFDFTKHPNFGAFNACVEGGGPLTIAQFILQLTPRTSPSTDTVAIAGLPAIITSTPIQNLPVLPLGQINQVVVSNLITSLDNPGYTSDAILGEFKASVPGEIRMVYQDDAIISYALLQLTCEVAHLDHFKCYEIEEPPLDLPQDVTLEDQFGAADMRVQGLVSFCNPVDKNGEGINDPTAHLACYRIRGELGFSPRDVLVENQFGAQSVTVQPQTLCVPSFKNRLCVGPPPDLVSWWPGDGNANDIQDGNPGTLQGGATFAAGKVGQGFLFPSGGFAGVAVPDDPSLDFGPGADLSVDAWIKPNPTATGVRDIVDKRLAPLRDRTVGYALFLFRGRLGFQLADSPLVAGAFSNFISPGPDLRDGVFHHVAVTVDRDSSTGGKLYVDGIVVLTFDPTREPGDLSNTEPLLIGTHPTPGFPPTFDGVIDEVEIFDRALTQAKIKAIFEAGSAGKCKTEQVSTSLDHFKCYEIEAPSLDQDVTLEDQFGAEDTKVRRLVSLCNPVDKNGEGINDPTAHLACYKIDGELGKQEVFVENQFGAQTVTLAKPETLCVPSSKTP